VVFGLWSRPPHTQSVCDAILKYGASFYIANVEDPDDLAAFDPVAFRRRWPRLPCMVCTHFGGFEYDRELARPYIEQGFTLLTECYLNENANATPAALNNRGRGLGWPGSCALLGVYTGALGRLPLSAYRDVIAPHPWSVYLFETMTEEDWATAKRWNRRI
jgi:hypothetical protein